MLYPIWLQLLCHLILIIFSFLFSFILLLCSIYSNAMLGELDEKKNTMSFEQMIKHIFHMNIPMLTLLCIERVPNSFLSRLTAMLSLIKYQFFSFFDFLFHFSYSTALLSGRSKSRIERNVGQRPSNLWITQHPFYVSQDEEKWFV